MRKQILAITLAIMTMSTVPTYAATITAGAGQTANAEQTSTSTEQSTEQAQSAESASASSSAKTVDTDYDITWLVPKGKPFVEYENEYGIGATDWGKAEAIAQAKKWAEDNKGDIPSIADEKGRYEAIVAKVCDFLTYDTNYQSVHIAYSIRDGKGVCAVYTTLTKNLCDLCGLQSVVVSGRINGLDHDMLKVTLNGKTYYSDPTNVDYSNQPVLNESIPSYFQFEFEADPNDTGARYTDGDVGNKSDKVLNMEAAKSGEAIIAQSKGNTYYGSIEDAVALDKAIEANDDATICAIFDKYGVPYLK